MKKQTFEDIRDSLFGEDKRMPRVLYNPEDKTFIDVEEEPFEALQVMQKNASIWVFEIEMLLPYAKEWNRESKQAKKEITNKSSTTK